MSDPTERLSIEEITSFNSIWGWRWNRIKAVSLAIGLWVIIILIGWLWIDEFNIGSRRWSHRTILSLIFVDAALIGIYFAVLHKHVIRSQNKFTGVDSVNRQTMNIRSPIEEEETEASLIKRLLKEIEVLKIQLDESEKKKEELNNKIKNFKEQCRTTRPRYSVY